MTIVLNGTTGITTPAVTNEGAYTGDGVVFADSTPSNTLVTTTTGRVGVGTTNPITKFVVSNAGANGYEVAADSDSGNQTKINSYNRAAASFTPLVTDASQHQWLTAGTERMRIDSSGNLLVGTTAPAGIEKVSIVFDNSSKVGTSYRCSSGTYTWAAINFLNASSSQVGYIYPNSTSTQYSTSSDYRLKENIAPMTGALAKVQALKPCTYTWKSTGESDEGFIAHELAEVCPSAVNGEKDATEVVDIKDEEGNVIGQETKPIYQGIDTSFLVATLTAAIQEQQAIIETQANAITALEARLTALEQA